MAKNSTKGILCSYGNKTFLQAGKDKTSNKIFSKMKRTLYIFLGMGLLLLHDFSAKAQYENIWVFGGVGSQYATDTIGAGLDFNNGDPTPILTSIRGFGEANASVCDANGSLLFYTEGSTIWDRNGNLMPNGYHLTGILNCANISPTTSSAQGTIIIPMPGNTNKYYVFSKTESECTSLGILGRLYYSVVDMDLNNGLGDVIPNQKSVFVDSNFTESMIAVQGDRCNIWLINQSLVSNASSHAFWIYEISESGINTVPVISNVPISILYSPPGGQMVVSPNRKKVVSGYHIYDFDPTTGFLSNPIYVEDGGYGKCFSSDNTKLYCLTSDSIFQFDISSNNPDTIATSKTYIGKAHFGHLKLSPNNKIYFPSPILTFSNNAYIRTKLGCIHNPNLTGAACQYVADAVTLIPGSSFNAGLPNVIPVINNESTYSNHIIHGKCFASNNTSIHAINNSTGWDYLWNTGATTTMITIDTPGTYYVSYRSPPCIHHIDTFHVSFPYGVLPSIHIDTACAGMANGGAYATTYPGDTVHYVYTWLSGADTLSLTDTFASVPSGSYTLLVHTVNCDTNLNFIIPEVDYQVSFTISDTLLCMGDALQFQNTSDTHFNQFAWYFGDGDSSLLATPGGHTYAHAGSYEIVIMGSGSICKDTTRQSVIVDSMYAITFITDQHDICMGDVLHFQLAEVDISFKNLLWDWGDGSYLSSDYANYFKHAFDHPGVWPVQVTLNARVCPSTSFIDTLQVYALPEVDLGQDTNLCLDGHAIVLRNLAAAPGERYHYLWNTGDTTAGLRVLQPGSYNLRITTEPIGCSTTDEIVVTKDCYTDIPNAFTPNADGDNDYFFPRTLLSKGVNDFRMQVFNRWGQIIFETTNIDGRGWDGRFNDKEQPLGVYLYLVDVAYSNGRQEQYQGNVTLIR